MKFLKYMILLILSTVFIYAGDSFMMSWKFYNHGAFYSIIFLIIWIPIWILVLFFGNKEQDKFFTNILAVGLLVLAFFFIISQIDNYIDTQNKKPNHEFSKQQNRDYPRVEDRVKSIINQAIRPWWSFTRIPFEGVTSDMIDDIREFYDNEKSITFDYSTKKISYYKYHIEVSSEYKPLKSMHFIIDSNATDTKLNSFSFKPREFAHKN